MSDYRIFGTRDLQEKTPVNKDELVTRIAENAAVNKKTANEILDAAVATIMGAVAGGDKVTLVGFGSFEARDRAEREGRNPRTGETMKIAATRVPAFSPGKIFKDKVVPEAVKEEKPSVKEDKPATTGKGSADAGGQKAGGKKK